MLGNSTVLKTVLRKYEAGETCEIGEIFRCLVSTTCLFSICYKVDSENESYLRSQFLNSLREIDGNPNPTVTPVQPPIVAALASSPSAQFLSWVGASPSGGLLPCGAASASAYAYRSTPFVQEQTVRMPEGCASPVIRTCSPFGLRIWCRMMPATQQVKMSVSNDSF